MDEYTHNAEVGDRELILQIQQGDEHAFAHFYQRHRSRMYFAAYDLLRDEDDAHDAVQELFSDLWQHARRIDANGNIKGYLYIVMRNKVLTSITRSKRFEEYINSYIAFEKTSSFNTDETVLARELERIFEEKIRLLPAKMREVYELYWRDNLSNKDIATKMNITEGTVKQHKHQALRILRQKLQRILSILFF